MKTVTSSAQLAVVSLIGLVVLHLIQFGALLAQLEVAPPQFLGPLIGSAIGLQVATIPLVLWRHKSRLWWIIGVILISLPSVGPQKFFIEPDALILTPMIVIGTIFTIVLIGYAVGNGRETANRTGREKPAKFSAQQDYRGLTKIDGNRLISVTHKSWT